MRTIPVAAMIAVLGCQATAPAMAQALAQECHGKPVTATGTPALLEVSAQSRARSAWIKRVRANRKLGPNYAAWLRSKEPSYVCRKAGKLQVCDATATPCKV